MKKIRKGFTLIELVTTIAVASILLVTLSTFLIFTSNMSTDYKEALNTSHNAYLMENTIKSYLESYDDLSITPFSYDDNAAPGYSVTFLSASGNEDSTLSLSYIYGDGNESFPLLKVAFTANSETYEDTIFSARSLLKLNISEEALTSSNNEDINRKYIFKITYTLKEVDSTLTFTKFLKKGE